MLTMEAFHALLKTLEEPPSHVKFIFATTEPHKLPAAILSRCQRFDFRCISIKDEEYIMTAYTRSMQELIEHFKRMPGITVKSAERLAL